MPNRPRTAPEQDQTTPPRVTSSSATSPPALPHHSVSEERKPRCRCMHPLSSTLAPPQACPMAAPPPSQDVSAVTGAAVCHRQICLAKLAGHVVIRVTAQRNRSNRARAAGQHMGGSKETGGEATKGLGWGGVYSSTIYSIIVLRTHCSQSLFV